MCRVIVEIKESPEYEATEITLSNGMRVCYKCTDFNDDEVGIHFIFLTLSHEYALAPIVDSKRRQSTSLTWHFNEGFELSYWRK